MSKSQTLMNKLKFHFKQLDELLNNLGCSKLELNKSDPTIKLYNYYSEYKTKGVESDFIRVYSIDSNISISFKFTIYDDKKGLLDEQLLTVIFKNKEQFNQSSVYVNNDSKDLMKGINKDIKEIVDTVVGTTTHKKKSIYDLLFKKLVDKTKELELENEFMSIGIGYVNEYNKIFDEQLLLKDEISNLYNELHDYVDSLNETKEIDEILEQVEALRKQVSLLRNKVNNKRDKKRKEIGLTDKIKTYNNNGYKMKSCKSMLEKYNSDMINNNKNVYTGIFYNFLSTLMSKLKR